MKILLVYSVIFIFMQPARAAVKIPDTESQLQTLRTEISHVENDLLSSKESAATAKVQLSRIKKLIELQKKEIRLSQIRVKELAKSLGALSEQKQKLLEAIAVQKQQLSKRLKQLDAFLERDPLDARWVQDFDVMNQREYYLSAVAKKNLDAVQTLRRNADDALALELRIIEEKAQIDYFVQEVKEQNTMMAANEQVQRDILVSNRSSRLEALKNLRELRLAEKELSGIISKIDREKKTAPVVPGTPRGGLAHWRGKLPFPVDAGILSGFGRSYNSRTNLFTFQKGILFSTAVGTEVHAVAAGKVAYSGPLKNYGFIVIVEHPGQYYTLYGQLGKVSAAEGTEIKQGQTVGSSATEPVYFEIRNRNIAMNPAQWLEARAK